MPSMSTRSVDRALTAPRSVISRSAQLDDTRRSSSSSLLRQPALLRRPPPAVDQRPGGDVEGARGRQVELLRPPQNLERGAGEEHLLARQRPVESGDLRGLDPGAEVRLEPPQLVLGALQDLGSATGVLGGQHRGQGAAGAHDALRLALHDHRPLPDLLRPPPGHGQRRDQKPAQNEPVAQGPGSCGHGRRDYPKRVSYRR